MAPPPNVVPIGIGQAIPKSPHELMKMIHVQNKKSKKAEKKDHAATTAPSDAVANKSEQQSERLETKLMELEDYTFKPEGVHRLLRIFEIMSMETEDELSAQLVVLYEQEQAKIALREQLRKEVEERKEQELRDKEERKRQAELRRQAVVERIRKQQEAEEQRKRDIENAIKQQEIDRLNAIQLELDNMLQNQLLMSNEEEYSRLAEQEYAEQLQRKIWQQKEKEKMLEWERQQKIKDELEDQKRLERMAALEERKQKLLKLQQQGGVDSKSNSKEEADKLNKQLRIQNKAKFVTKKIQTAQTKAEEDTVVSVQAENIDAVINTVAQPAATILESPSMPVEVVPELTKEQIKFVQEVENITSEVVLKELQKELMDEKRTLRLEQRTRKSANTNAPGNNNDSTKTSEQSNASNDQLKQNIEVIAYKESIVEKCLEKLTAETKAAEEVKVNESQPIVEQPGIAGAASSSSHSLKGHNNSHGKLVRTNSLKNSNASNNVTSASTPVPLGAAPGIAASSPTPLIVASNSNKVVAAEGIHKLERAGTKPKLIDLGTSSRNLLGTNNANNAPAVTVNKANEVSTQDVKTAAVTAPQPHTTPPVSSANALFKQAEALLRESNQLMEWSTAYIKSIRNGTVDASIAAPGEQQHANLRRLTILVMEIPQLGKSIAKEFDPLGYGEQLTKMGIKVKDTLAAINKATTDAANAPPPKIGSTKSPAVEMKKSATVSTLSPATREPTMMVSASVSNINPGTATPSPTNKAPSPADSPIPPIASSPSQKIDETDEEEPLSDDELEAEQVILSIPGWDECINTTMATAAHHAAFYGYVKVLEVLCQYFDCFVMDKKGRTPLFYACLQNQLDCVACLVSLNPAWLDVGDFAGDAPLHAAAIANGIEVLRFLLSCEAHPDTANYSGLTPSHLARTKDALVVLYEAKALLYCVDNKNRMPLWYAASDGRAECCKFLCSVMPYNFMLYKDDEGDSALHKASANGHADCVEVICSFLQGVEDLYVINKKAHTAAHVASNSGVLKALYENGANLFSCDPKARNPLFFASFFGRLDCIIFLIEIAFTIHEKELKNGQASNGSAAGSGRNAIQQMRNIDQEHAADVPDCMKAADIQGDTALHAACLCGHIQCVNVLCYYLLNIPNKQGISPEQLAIKAGHTTIAQLVSYYDMQRTRMWAETVEDIDDTSASTHNINSVFSMQAVYGCDFNTLVSTLQYYGSRWHQGYDPNFGSVYYIDNAIVGYSQWERPQTYDESPKAESHYRKAAEVLYAFYARYNPEKISDMNHILTAFRNNYTELFISLANKYNVEDLSMFSGVDFDS